MLVPVLLSLLPTLALAAPKRCAARAVPPAQDAFTSTIVARPALSSSSVPVTPVQDCKCGYVLSSFNDAYYDTVNVLSFETFANGPLGSASALDKLGWDINDSLQVGGPGPDGTVTTGSMDTLSVQDGVLHMTVSGGQGSGGKVLGAELHFGQPLTGGVFTMEAQLDSTPGTCQAIFTYRNGEHGDEQDIEVLGQSMLETGPNGTPEGIQLTNWDPSATTEVGHKNENVIIPFPSDPSTGFHNYTIAWLSDETRYEYDGEALKGPSKYRSVNPSTLMLNHWTNGNPGFTAGPPISDVVMKVKRVTAYYQSGKDKPSGCTKEAACMI